MDLFEDLPDPDQSKTDAQNETGQTVAGYKRKLPENESKPDIEHDNNLKRRKDDDSEMSPKVLHLKGFVADRQGEREDMQDAHVIMDDLLSHIPNPHPSLKRLALYCIFDGHGGGRASRFASQNLHTNLLNKFPKGDVANVEKEIKKVLIETFRKTDEEFLKEARLKKPSWKDGSTAVVVVAINDTLYIANLGDSKAILCRHKATEGKFVGIPLTSDQTPSIYEERMRIQKAGGWVKEGRVLGQLEVSRSIGDGPYKKHGVICIPEVKRCQLTENDKYILMACDGLWKSYSVDESIQFINALLKDNSVEGNSRVGDVRYEAACGKLASSAVLKLSGDNVTVLLVAIRMKEEKT